MQATRVVAFLACLGVSTASHFRYGTISWVPMAGNGVEFTFLSAWRRSYWPGSGLGGDTYVVAGETFEVASGGKGNKWYFGDSDGPDLRVLVTRPASIAEHEMDFILDNALGESVLSHTYSTPIDDATGQPWLAGYRGCCRLDAHSLGDPSGDEADGLNNNGGRSWDVRTKVDLSGGPLPIMKDKSPTAVGGKPILRLRMDTVERFDIFSIDPDDDPLTWRMAMPDEMGDPENKQPGWGTNLLREETPYNSAPMTQSNKMTIENKIVVNARGETVRFGEALWDTMGLNTGYWQSTIMIHSTSEMTGSTAEIPYDFLLLVKNPMKNEPPLWDDGAGKTPLPQDSLEVVCPTGDLSYTMVATDSSPNDIIIIHQINDPPSGMQHSPIEGLGPGGYQNPVMQIVNWTPSCFQKGKSVMCYQATDNNAIQELDSRVRCVIITVTEITNKKPTFCGIDDPVNGQQIPVCVGQPVYFSVEVCDENVEDVVSIKFKSGVPVGSVITPEIAPQAYPNFPDKNKVRRTFNLDPQQSLEDGNICFEGVDIPPVSASTGVSSSLSTGLRCVRLTVRYPPRFIPPTPLGQSEGNFRFVAKVCHETSFTVTAEDKNMDTDEDVTIFVLEDPGIPNGAVVEPNVCPVPQMDPGTGQLIQGRCNPVSRQFKWSPAKGTEGKTYMVCFIARDNKDNCQVGGYFSQAKDNPCVDISVIEPQPTFSSSTPADASQFSAYVGCEHTHTAQCYDASTDSGKQVAPEFGYDVAVTSNTLPFGAILSNCKDVGDEKQPICSRTFNWKPSRGQEGKSYDICYTCSDVGCDVVVDPVHGDQAALPAMNYTTQRCMTITVERCKYCVQEGDTLYYVNKFYHLDTNWMWLWNANGNSKGNESPIHDPDLVLHNGQVLSIGPVYRVQSGDSLVVLAARFHTTVKKILAVNPDMDGNHHVSAGQHICVMPCTDSPQQPTPSKDYRYAY